MRNENKKGQWNHVRARITITTLLSHMPLTFSSVSYRQVTVWGRVSAGGPGRLLLEHFRVPVAFLFVNHSTVLGVSATPTKRRGVLNVPRTFHRSCDSTSPKIPHERSISILVI